MKLFSFFLIIFFTYRASNSYSKTMFKRVPSEIVNEIDNDVSEDSKFVNHFQNKQDFKKQKSQKVEQRKLEQIQTQTQKLNPPHSHHFHIKRRRLFISDSKSKINRHENRKTRKLLRSNMAENQQKQINHVTKEHHHHSNSKRALTASPNKSNLINVETRGNLDQLVEATIKNTPNQQPKIIVINQPITIGSEAELKDLSIYDVDKGRYVSGEYPPKNYKLQGSVVVYEMDGLVQMLDQILLIYSSFYTMLPGKDSTTSINDKSLNLLDFYGKVRAFVNGFMSARAKLTQDLKFCVTRLLTFRIGQDSMLMISTHNFNYLKSSQLFTKVEIVNLGFMQT